jgi:hypothetical protein
VKCPECSKQMILWSKGLVYPTSPPMYVKEWRCGCGHTQSTPNEWGKTEEQVFMTYWKAVNIK